MDTRMKIMIRALIFSTTCLFIRYINCICMIFPGLTMLYLCLVLYTVRSSCPMGGMEGSFPPRFISVRWCQLTSPHNLIQSFEQTSWTEPWSRWQYIRSTSLTLAYYSANLTTREKSSVVPLQPKEYDFEPPVIHFLVGEGVGQPHEFLSVLSMTYLSFFCLLGFHFLIRLLVVNTCTWITRGLQVGAIR